jgi:peptidoglycan/xylan/chitin deacetylase (PgdA/CDA1 family)
VKKPNKRPHSKRYYKKHTAPKTVSRGRLPSLKTLFGAFILIIGLFVLTTQYQPLLQQWPFHHRGTKNPLPHSINEGKGIPILSYHIVTPHTGKGSYGFISQKLFTEELDSLKAQHYTTVGLDEVYAYMQASSTSNLPDKPIVLTFDDTNESDYTIVFPELQKRHMKGVFFAIGARAETPLWRARFAEMHAAGMEIESHTMNHLYMGGGPSTGGKRENVYGDGVVNYELSNPRKILQNITGSSTYFLAWPGDSYTDHTIELAQKAGYKGLLMAKTAYTNNIMHQPEKAVGFNRPGDDVWHIKRLTVSGADTLADFKAMLNDGMYPRP